MMFAPAKSAPLRRAKVAKSMQFASPVRGLDLFSDIAQVPQGFALVLENAVCETDIVRPRGGSVARNTGLPGRVRAILPYRALASKLFAVAADGETDSLYDVTASGAAGSAMITGLVPAVWSFTQFGSSGGSYLVAVAAGNTRRLWDGSAWSTAPAITGVTATSLSQVWQHGNRLFFVEQNSLNAWYLAVDAIGGAAIKFPLVFPKGGTLVAGSTWTSDAGTQGGQSAQCLFLSSEGEVAVYDGVDPSTWSIVGTYFVGKPCGINCFMKAGGDVIVMTEDGMFAMSQIVSLDAAALVNQSVSKNIRPLWRASASRTDKARWQIVRRDIAGYALISAPSEVLGQSAQFVINLQTGAWATWAGWSPTVFAVFGDELVFGSADGKIYNGDAGGRDAGAIYSTTFLLPFQSNGMTLVPLMARAIVRSYEVFEPQLTAIFDYSTIVPSPPSVAMARPSSGWDADPPEGWDVSLWDEQKTMRDRWQGVYGTGEALSICMQYSFDQVDMPDIDILRIDCSYHQGDMQV